MISALYRLSRLMGACLLVGALGVSTCLAAATEQKIALVIGNSAYPTAALRNPVNDAKAMATKLGALGFEVILRLDASQRDMTRAVSQFGQKLRGGSVGLFYFAGHGMQVRGKNFLIPIDAEIENEASTRSEAVDVDQVLEQLGSARLSMVILDACRNNPFERRFRSSGSGGLAQIDAPTGTLLAYATAPGKVAYDGTGANGLYTTELLKALDTPGLKVEDVFKQVRINVLKASDNQQIPWESSSLTGEFFFRPDVRPQMADVMAQQAARERAEMQKALDDERRRRDQDAEVLRKEMEKLRAELMRFSEAAATAKAAATAPPLAPAQPAPAPVVAAGAKPVAAPATGTPPAVVALAATSPAATVAAAAPKSEDWAVRIALLEKLQGKLTFSKALATLLNITDGDDLTRLLTLEQHLTRAAFSNAHAVGIDSTGRLGWAGLARHSSVSEAGHDALEFCNSGNARQCRVLFANGVFDENEFMALAKLASRFDFSVARSSYLESVREPPRESTLQLGGTTAAGRVALVYVSAVPPAASASGDQRSVAVLELPRLSQEAVEGWDRRIAAVAQQKGRASFSRAMEMLLDIKEPDDRAVVSRLETDLGQMQFTVALAIGVNASHQVHWVAGGRFVNINRARETIGDACAKDTGNPCHLVYLNREIDHSQLMAFAEKLKRFDVAGLRAAFVQGLRKPFTETRALDGGSSANAYTSLLSPSPVR